MKRPHVKHDDQGGSGSPARGTGVTRALLLISAGAAAAVVLVLHYDVSAIGDSLGAVGGLGLVAIVAANFVPMMLCSVAWRILLPGEIGVAAFIWFRYTRDATGDILGFIPGAGEFAALREMIRYGVERRLGAGVLVADLTLQMIAQLAFTVAGVALLFDVSSGTPMTRAALVGLGLLVGILVAFIFVQHWGLGRMLAALARCILPDALRSYPAMLAEFDEQLRNTYADRRRVAVATTLHIAAWFIGIGEAGLALGLMGAWPGLKAVLILESLVFALRTTPFFVPGALGVQEAAYVLLGSVFGLAPETMLALALVKRARELAVGVPVLVAGQIISAVRPFARTRLAPTPIAGGS